MALGERGTPPWWEQTDAERRRRWQADVSEPDPTERALVELRLRLLDEEATALEALLAAAPPAPAA